MWGRAGMTDDQSERLRAYTSRLYAEINQDRPRTAVKQDDIVAFINEMKKSYENSEQEKSNAQDCDNILKDLEEGDSSSALGEVEKIIGHIQSLIEETKIQKDPSLKEIAKNGLTELYGNAYLAKLGQLRSYREYINQGIKKTEKGIDSNGQNSPENKPNLTDEELTNRTAFEGSKDIPKYFDIKEKIDLLDDREAESLWQSVGETLRAEGILVNHRSEGIDVLSPESNWITPYPVIKSKEQEIQHQLESEYKNIGGYYDKGNVFLNEKFTKNNSAKDNLSFLVAGYGLGEMTETVLHETYHGFQNISPQEVRSFNNEIRKLEDSIKAAELEDKIKGKSSTKPISLRSKLIELKKVFEKRCEDSKPESLEELIDRHLLQEVHSHMFADPLKYIADLKNFSKDEILSTYFDMPVKRINEVMVGVKREKEDSNSTYRYDYIKGKEEQAYRAFSQIEALRALGINNSEIGQIISRDKYDSEKGHYVELRKRLTELRQEKGISTEDLDKVIESFRLQTVHNALRARNIAIEAIRKRFKD
jgi:hypothetical protein